jgi:hypothetical protein
MPLSDDIKVSFLTQLQQGPVTIDVLVLSGSQQIYAATGKGSLTGAMVCLNELVDAGLVVRDCYTAKLKQQYFSKGSK